MSIYIIIILLTIKSILKNPLKIFTLAQFFIYKTKGKNKITVSVPTLKNLKMVLDLNSHMDKSIFLSGICGKNVEEDLYKFLTKYLKNDSVFFDIGANSGYFPLLASNIIDTGEIHAFEPVPYTYRNFKDSTNLNNIRKIKLNNACVGNKNGIVKFYVSFHSDVSGLKVTKYQKGNRLIKSNMVTLDNYCKENNIKKLDIIKIDTEGGEKDIIFSSIDLIKRFRPKIIIEFCDKTAQSYGYHPNEIYDFLTKLGYKAHKWDGKNLKMQVKKDYYEDEDIYFIHKN